MREQAARSIFTTQATCLEYIPNLEHNHEGRRFIEPNGYHTGLRPQIEVNTLKVASIFVKPFENPPIQYRDAINHSSLGGHGAHSTIS